jgi:hypothetical protein
VCSTRCRVGEPIERAQLILSPHTDLPGTHSWDDFVYAPGNVPPAPGLPDLRDWLRRAHIRQHQTIDDGRSAFRRQSAPAIWRQSGVFPAT